VTDAAESDGPMAFAVSHCSKPLTETSRAKAPLQVIDGDGATDDKNDVLLDVVAVALASASNHCGNNAASYRRVHGDGAGSGWPWGAIVKALNEINKLRKILGVVIV
jgi:hypothetical protein